MNWLLIIIEVVIAVATFRILHRVAFFERQSRVFQILIAAVILFVLFTLVRFLLPGVSAL